MKRNIARYFMPVYAGIVTISIIYLFGSFRNLRDSFEEISVKRINIVDEQGRNRIVIANQKHMPNPIIAGKEYQRRVAPAGLIFYDERGDEVGGIALSEVNNSGLRALAFDYANADAIGMLAQDDRLGGKNFKAGIVINDKDISGKPGSNISRLKLITENGNAGLIINGPDEQPRITISVDSAGNPLIQVHDADGKVRKAILQ